MAQYDNRYAQAGTAARHDGAVVVDEGLRSYMLSVYNYMAAGVALTGVVAYSVFSAAVTTDQAAAAGRMGKHLLTPFGKALYGSPLMFVVALLPLAFVLFLSFRVYKMSAAATQLTFWLFSAAMGASLSTIFLRYTGTSITNVFFVTAAAFAGLSLYGYTTKRDLSGWGSFLIMGLIGIIIAALVNIFLQSSALQFAISVLGVLIFAGLTAYDTQTIKDHYYQIAGDATLMAKGAIMGALELYLDFINMFTSMLQLFGSRD